MDSSWDFETLKEDLEGWNSITLRSTGLSPFLSEPFFLSHLTPHPSTRQSANDLVSLRAVLRMPKPLRFSVPSSEEWGKDHFLHPMTSILYWSYYNHVGAITSGVASAVLTSLTLHKVPRGQWRRWVTRNQWGNQVHTLTIVPWVGTALTFCYNMVPWVARDHTAYEVHSPS